MITNVKSESQSAITAALEEKWRGITVPTFEQAFAEAPTADDRTLLSLVHEDLTYRRVHRSPFRFADYARVVPGIAGKRHVAKAILAELLRRDQPVDPKAYLGGLIAEFPDLEGCRDVLESFDEQEPIDLAMPVNGRFSALERLGSGGFGTVVRARDQSDGKVVALKLFAPGARSGTEDRALRRFERESRLLKKIDHPGIARVVDFSIADQPPWIALELVDGRDLSFWIDRETVDRRRRGGIDREREAARIKLGLAIFISAARALSAAHRADVLHRDLKPANIILRADGTAVIVDFGLARDLSETEDAVAAPVLSLSREFKGSPPYAPPESIPGHPLKREVDHRSDIYGLAAVFYHWLTLRRPFFAESDSAILEVVRRSLPVDLKAGNPLVTDELCRVVHAAMSRFPENRYATADDFAAALEDVLESRPPKIPRPPLTRRLRQINEENPGVVRLSAMLILILTAGLLTTSLLLWRNGELRMQLRNERDNAFKAAKKSDDDARRAREAEEATASALRAENRIAMDLAESRGDPREFLERSAGYINDPAVAGPALCMRRIRAALADRDVPTVMHEIARLDTMELSPREAADAKLLNGEKMLFNVEKAQEGEKMIRLAIESGLSTLADTFYARGLIEKKTKKAIEHFRAALAEDPSHRRARMALGFIYLLLGDGVAAGNEADGMLVYHPKEPFGYWIGIWAADLRGDLVRREHWMKLCRDRVGPEKFAYVSSTIEKSDDLRRRAAIGETQFDVIEEQLKRLRNLWQHPESLGPATRILQIEVPLITRVQALQGFLENVKISRRDSTGSQVDTLDGIAEDHPDGYFRHLAAGAHMMIAKSVYEEQGGKEITGNSDWRREIITAYRKFAEASTMSSIYPKARVESLHFQLIVGSLISHWPEEYRPAGIEDELYVAAVELFQRGGLTQEEWGQIHSICLGEFAPPGPVVDLLVRARSRQFPNEARTIEGEILYHLKFGRIEAARAALEDGKRRFPTRSGWGKLEARFQTVEPESRPADSRPVGR